MAEAPSGKPAALLCSSHGWPDHLHLFVDLQGSVLYGQGIGRYASGQLAGVVVGPTGNLQPLTSVQFLVGAVAHPFAGNDIYVYYGQEQTQANAWTVGGVAGQGRAQVRYASAQPYAAASGVVCMVA